MKEFTLGAVVASGLALGLSSGTALAAEDAPQDAPAASVSGLQSVVVQARRREEKLSDVPASVSVLTAEAIKNAGIASVEGLTQYSPGLNIAEGVDANTARFFIRGIGTATPAVGVEPSVPLYIDDVYTPSGLGSNINLFSVDRVEVLRGPQGTLYGRNSFGGAIKVYTKNPTDRDEGYVEVATGDHHRRDLKTELSGAITPGQLWFNLGAASLQRDGYQTMAQTGAQGWGENTKVFKAKLKFEPSKDVRLTLAYDKTDGDAPAKQAKITSIGNYVFNSGVLAGYPGVVANRPQSSSNPDVIDSDVKGNSKVFANGLTWSAQWRANDDLTLKYLGAQRHMENVRLFDIEGTAAPFLTVNEDLKLKGSSHELQFNWNAGRLNLVGGLFRYSEDTRSLGAEVNNFLQFLDTKHQARLVTDPQGRTTAVDIRRVFEGLSQQTSSTAAFVNGSYEASDVMNISAGLRFTRDHKATQGNRPSTTFVGGSLADFSGNAAFTVPAGATIIDTGFGAGLSGERTFTAVTPEASLDYKLAPDHLLYGSYKRGFQAGTIFPTANVVPGAALSTNAQGVDAFEVGSKAVYLDGRLSLNAALYYNRYKDLIVSVNTPVPVAVSATGFAGVPQNAGKADSKGIELESRFQATPALMLTTNVAYNQFTVREVMSTNAAGARVNLANTFLDVPTLSPKLQGNLRAEYTLPAGAMQARLWGNLAYRGKMGINAANASESSGLGLVTANPVTDAYYVSEAMTTISGGISLTTADKKWRIDLVGQNLGDQRRPISAIAVVPEFFGAIRQWNEPRTWRLSLTRSL